jgi:hypothetical protein
MRPGSGMLRDSWVRKRQDLLCYGYHRVHDWQEVASLLEIYINDVSIAV